MSKNTCRSCGHRIKAASGKGVAMYCDCIASARTRNGHLRVKCNQPACSDWMVGEGTTEQVTNQLSLFGDEGDDINFLEG